MSNLRRKINRGKTRVQSPDMKRCSFCNEPLPYMKAYPSLYEGNPPKVSESFCNETCLTAKYPETIGHVPPKPKGDNKVGTSRS